jgi:hypothetical protein
VIVRAVCQHAFESEDGVRDVARIQRRQPEQVVESGIACAVAFLGCEYGVGARGVVCADQPGGAVE